MGNETSINNSGSSAQASRSINYTYLPQIVRMENEKQHRKQVVKCTCAQSMILNTPVVRNGRLEAANKNYNPM